MKRFLPLALALLTSCSLRQYSLVVVDPVPLHGEGGIATDPVDEVAPKDTITVLTKNRKASQTKRKYITDLAGIGQLALLTKQNSSGLDG